MTNWFRQFPQALVQCGKKHRVLKYPIVLSLLLMDALCRGIHTAETLVRPAIRRRVMAAAISACMAVTMLPMQAFAAEPTQNVGSLCEHHTEHTPECGFVGAVEGAPCGFTPNVPEVASPSDATEQEAAPVAHIHDEECGYIEAVEGVPCGFVCEICNAEEEESTVDNSVVKQQPALLSDIMPITDTGWVLDESGLLTISTPEGMSDWVTKNSTDENARKAVKKLVLEDAVTVIPNGAFKNCTQLTSVTGEGIVTIENDAFYNASVTHSLTTADFPNAVTIGNSAFLGCYSLTTVNFPKAETIGEMAFLEAKLSAPAFPSVTTIGKGAFACMSRNGTALKSISLPNVTNIGSIAFAKCTKFAEISLPATPPASADDAFKNCANPRNLKFVDENGTELTDKTEAIEAYSKTTGVADGLWYGWIINKPVNRITIQTDDAAPVESVSLKDAIGDKATTLKKLEITGGSFLDVDWNYLKELTAMETFIMADTVETVDVMPQAGAYETLFPKSIQSVSIKQAGITALSDYAFLNCTNLINTDFPTITTIGKSTFAGCTSLASVSLPKVTFIDEVAFNDCTALASLLLPAKPPELRLNLLFNNCQKTRTLGYVDADGKALTGTVLTEAQKAYKEIDDNNTTDNLWYGWDIGEPVADKGWAIDASGNLTISTADGMTDWVANGLAANKDTVKTATIAEAVTEIPKEAFYYCKQLEEVTAPGVTNIGERAFESCTALTSVTANGAIGIGRSAFSGCTALTGAIFPAAKAINIAAFSGCTTLTNASFPAVMSISGSAFSGCTALTNASFPVATFIDTYAFNNCTALTNASFPTAKTISYSTFNNCTALTSASFPAAKTISASAFSGCSKLATLNLPAAPPSGMNADAFKDCPAPRALTFVDASGNLLTGEALTAAQAAYKVVDDSAMSGEAAGNDTWYGWTIVSQAPTVTSVAVTPNTTNVQKGKTQQFTAAVTGTNSPAQTVTWKVTGGKTGTGIGAGGLLTVAADETATTLTVTATSTVDTTKSGTAAVTVMTAPAISTVTSVAVTPNTTNVQKGKTQQFTAAVTGTNSPAQTVTWKVTGGKTGTGISAGGLLTVAADETATTLTVTATSTVDTTKSGTAAVAVTTTPVTKYTLTVTGGTGSGSFEANATVSISADAPETGKVFDKWTTADGVTFADTNAAITTITMPAKDATVTAAYKDESATVPVTGVTLNKSAISLYSNTTPNTETLTATITPSAASNQGVLWSSGNTSVATVANGVVIAVGNGTTTITVTTADSGKTASCTVNVSTYSSGGGSSSDDGSSGSSGSTIAPSKPPEAVSGSSNAPATADSNGNITVNVSDKNISDAVQAAKDTASKKGVTEGEVTAVINVTAPANSNPNTVTVNLPKTVQEQVISSKIGNVAVVIDKPDISISMNLATITEMNKQANADIQLSATRTDATNLSTEAKNAIGSRPAFDLKATYASGSKSVTSFGTGMVSVAIPYTLQNGEVAGGLYAVYVDGNGKVNYITNSSYDAENKVLRFSTNHFSVYGIGYKAPIGFTDIANHWAKTDIEFVVNRGLMNGTSDTIFAPDQAISRQEMAVIMSNYASALQPSS